MQAFGSSTSNVSLAKRYPDNLGSLRKGPPSQAQWISRNGRMTGVSQIGEMDPLVPGLPQVRAVLWRGGKIVNLGTLSGGHFTAGNAVNTKGQVAGVALNAVPDPVSIFPFGFEARAFLWHNGHMKDLGTLGGLEAFGKFRERKGPSFAIFYDQLDSESPNRNSNHRPVLLVRWQNAGHRHAWHHQWATECT
jgi:uncharacterized membrane protein